MHTKKPALVPYKTCAKCGGTGRVLCDGYEHHRARSKAWAEQFHLQPVMVERIDQRFPGLAVRDINPGGWGAVKVYALVTDRPPQRIYDSQGDYVESLRSIMRYFSSADYIGDKAFWYTTVSWGYRDNIHLLNHWPDGFSLQDRKLIEEGYTT